jgi:hypothetical protein
MSGAVMSGNAVAKASKNKNEKQDVKGVPAEVSS